MNGKMTRRGKSINRKDQKRKSFLIIPKTLGLCDSVVKTVFIPLIDPHGIKIGVCIVLTIEFRLKPIDKVLERDLCNLRRQCF